MTDDRSKHGPFELVTSGAEGQLPAEPVAAPPPMLEDDEEGGGVDLRRYVAAVLRHKWWVLALVVIGTAAGYLASKRVSPEYVAQTTIWIEQAGSGRGSTVDAGPIRSSQLLESTAWIDLLRSYVVLDPVVIEEQLYLHPQRQEDAPLLAELELETRFAPGDYRLRVDRGARAYTLETQEGMVVERGAFGDPVGASLGFRWRPNLSRFPADRSVQFRVASPRDEAIRLGRSLRTQIDKTGGFLRVELNGEDPEKTASILNSLAARHVEVAAELKREKLDTLVSILREQLLAAETGLREAEIALEDFKIATVTLPSDRSTPVAPGIEMTQDPVFGNFFGMKVELEQIRRDRDALVRGVNADEGRVSVETLESVGSVQQASELRGTLTQLTERRAELRALQARYTSEHAAVASAAEAVERLETEIVPAMVNRLLAELRTRENQLEGNIAAASTELRQIPTRSIEEARLQRQVAIQGDLYTTLEQRYQEARLAAASSIPDIRILDEASVPRQPVRDQQYTLLLMGFMASLGLGIGGAILRDRLDSRIRYPSEVTRGLGLSILGAVPTLAKGGSNRDHVTQVLESFRSIRLNVTHAFGAAGALTVTVTSPGPGDGKSFVASNLALSFADQGHRTCLVDGDTRRGALHHLLDVDRKPGLTDLLTDRTVLGAAIRPTRFKGLDLITSGTRVRKGPELLGSPQMRDLLATLKSEYDVVIVDSPPLGAGVDPFALGTLTGHLLLVLRSGTTNRELAEGKLELLGRLPIRILGAILNGVPQSRHYGYGYYSYSYVPGYEAIDEETTEAREPLQVTGQMEG